MYIDNETKSCLSFHNYNSSINLYKESPMKSETICSTLLRKESTMNMSYESDSYKNSDVYSLCEIDTIDNFKNNYDDEEYNINYTIELTRQELEMRLKRESDIDMRTFCKYNFYLLISKFELKFLILLDEIQINRMNNDDEIYTNKKL